MGRTPTPPGPPRKQSAAGSSDPETSLGAENPKSLPPPEIVTGAELGSLFDLSERSIREYRARGIVVRRGNGYDFRRSVRGMLDHTMVEAAKRFTAGRGDWLWQELQGALEYRREISDRLDRVEAGIYAVLAMPDLPEAARAALADLLPPDSEED